MIFTFYSYKGGVGRSMGLANVAELLVSRGLNVLMVDWDLEAPGLERYFPVDVDAALKQAGVVEMILDYQQLLATPDPEVTQTPPALALPDLRSYVLEVYPEGLRPQEAGELWLMPAGRRAADEFGRYGEFVRSFDWQDFYQNWEGESFIEWFRRQAVGFADAVLIDSRTGVTELGGICTYQLADVVVMFCGANSQNLEGTETMATSFTDPEVVRLRRDRPLHVIVVPARVEDRAEARDLSAFRDDFLHRFGRQRFAGPRALAAPAEDLWELRIPHVPYYAFREAVTVRDPESVRHPDMYEAFSRLVEMLGSLSGVDWPAGEDGRAPVPRRDPSTVTDFFISYAHPDRSWAEWIGWTLESAGYSVIVQAWDFSPGTDFIHQMEQAISGSRRMIAVLTPAYLASQYGSAEWTAMLQLDPTGAESRLLPVRVAPVELPGLLRTRIYVDLVDLDRGSAEAALLAAVRAGRQRPELEPRFPGGSMAPGAARFPGEGPGISNVPPRNPNFIDREALLEELRRHLAGTARGIVSIAALHGLAGIGKTQVAVEYAHRYAADYDLIWWIPAESPAEIGSRLSVLARRVGLLEHSIQEETVGELWEELGRKDRWLLVYDNAEDPGDLVPWLPAKGSGHALLTSRNPAWGALARPMTITTLDRDQAVTYLQRRTGSDRLETLAALAEALGDLPLALEQAAAYIEQTLMRPDEYLELLERRAPELLARGGAADFEATVATSFSVALERLAQDAPAALELLRLCAFLAPDDVPEQLITGHPDRLPEQLAASVQDPLDYREVLGALRRYSLVRVDADIVSVHRLVQAVVRGGLDPLDRRASAAVALGVVGAAFPDDPADVPAWSSAARLLPHALAAAGHAEEAEVEVSETVLLLNRCASYLWSRGHYRQAASLLQRALRASRTTTGPDSPELLLTMHNYAAVLEALGELEEARGLLLETLEARRRILGREHPDTLASMDSLGVVLRLLGRLQEAREVQEQAVDGRQRVLGEDHPGTLASLSNLAVVRRDLGDLEGARVLLEQALAGYRRVLGKDHPDTLASLDRLGVTLSELGDLEGARVLLEQALAGSRRVLGADHPATASVLHHLALVHLAQGDPTGGRALLEQVLASREATFGPDHPLTVRTRAELAG